MNKRILVGSQRFFRCIDGFNPKDVDYVNLNEEYDNLTIHRSWGCTFMFIRKSAEEFVQQALRDGQGLFIGKFLVPEFAHEVGITMEHLKVLEPLLNRLDEKHLYEKVIFEAYLVNGGFFLTDEQVRESYEVYLKYRSNGGQKID